MKSKKIVTFLLVISLLIIFAQNTSAKVESTINLKKIKGYTEYKIGGSDYGFVSLLEFPINHNFIGGKISYERDYRYEFSLYTNLTEKAGKMKDSDWIYDFGIEGKDIYSESDSYLNNSYLLTLEITNNLKNNENFHFKTKSGYKQQYFDYTIKDGIQYGGITGTGRYIPKDYGFILSGELLEYTVYYEIPYIGFDVFYKNKNCNFSYGMDFSNYVRAYDRDDHLLRDKISYSEAEGNYYYVDSNFQYIIKKNIRLNISLSYLFIETLGLQKQYKYGGKTKEFIGSVITRIESEQSSLSLGIEIDF